MILGMAHNSSHVTRERYEPLPGIAGLPAWIWRRLPTPAKVLLALLPFIAIGLVIALGPGIERSKEERARSEAQQIEHARAMRNERIRREQRPHFGQGEPAGRSLAARQRLLDEASVAVRADARARVAAGSLDGPIRGVQCERYPQTASGTGAEDHPSRRYGRYSCLAVTTEFGATATHEGGAIGHPYRMRVDFDSGRFALCKIAGRAGEGGITEREAVPVPRACGGS
jgi:hypothetical protein